MHTFWQDVRYGPHMLGKNPGFASVAILTLALGIGANTAIFALMDQIVVRNLPVMAVESPEPDILRSSGRPDDHGSTDCDGGARPVYNTSNDSTVRMVGLRVSTL